MKKIVSGHYKDGDYAIVRIAPRTWSIFGPDLVRIGGRTSWPTKADAVFALDAMTAGVIVDDLDGECEKASWETGYCHIWRGASEWYPLGIHCANCGCYARIDKEQVVAWKE